MGGEDDRYHPPARLGLAYAGSAREDVIEVLTPVMEDSNSSFEVSQCH